MKNSAPGRGPDADDLEQRNQGANPRPTNARLQDRSSAPDKYATSGMERAMHAHANRVHSTKRR